MNATAPGHEINSASYADPGHQDDKLQRYPLDSVAHVRSALAYIGMPGNADKYKPAQLKDIKAAIYQAAKRYGIDAYHSVSDHAKTNQQ